jgi:hypothetical protein
LFITSLLRHRLSMGFAVSACVDFCIVVCTVSRHILNLQLRLQIDIFHALRPFNRILGYLKDNS